MQEYEKTTNYLRNMTPLDGLGVAKLQTICIMLKPVVFGRNQTVIAENDVDTPFYVVKSGELKVLRHQIPPADTLGMLSRHGQRISDQSH